jgi:hypothetical protein
MARHALMLMSVNWVWQIVHNYVTTQLETTSAVVKMDTVSSLICISAKISMNVLWVMVAVNIPVITSLVGTFAVAMTVI